MRQFEQGKELNKVEGSCLFVFALEITLLLAIVLPGCQRASSEDGSNYTIINTGIKSERPQDLCWYDASRLIILKGEQPPGVQDYQVEGLYYISIHNPQQVKKIELEGVDPLIHREIKGVYCQDQTILFYTFPDNQKVARLYTVKIGERPEVISEMRGGLASLKGHYVLGNSRKTVSDGGLLQGVFEGNDDCAISYLKAGFKALCWDSSFEKRWPLEKFVLTEYKWDDTIKMRGANGQPKFVPNPDKQLLGTDGKPLGSALFLRDLQNTILVNLSDRSGIYHGFTLGLILSPDEQYAVAPCRRLDRPHRGADAVCRYLLDGNVHEWENLFTVNEGHEYHLGIESLAMAQNGDVYFIVRTTTGKYRGIWRFISSSRRVAQITSPPAHTEDGTPRVSADGTWAAFSRTGKDGAALFLLREKGR